MTARTIHSTDEMMKLGAEVASTAKPGHVFGLVGALGTGKTHWSKGFIGAIDSGARVTSPTFSIVNEYRGGGIPMFHFDLYRLQSADELVALGWDEYLDENGIVICEWADLFPSLLPENTIWLEILHAEDDTRLVSRIKSPVLPAEPH